MKKLLAPLLALVMALSLLPVQALAAEAGTYTVGEDAAVQAAVQPLAASTADITGSGTEADPYLIYTAEGLKAFRDKVNGGDTNAHAKLMADIVLNDGTFDENGNYTKGASGRNTEEWTPIGNIYRNYCGTFDGDGYTIKGLYVNGSVDPAGLFGIITRGAAISNLIVTGFVAAESDGYSGGIVGKQNGGSIAGCINACTVQGDYCGGITGEQIGGSITGCINACTVQGKHCGGIVGVQRNGSITNCYNIGTIRGGDGIAFEQSPSFDHHSASITNCYSIGKLADSGHGILGCQREGNTSVNNCYYLTGTAKDAVGIQRGTQNNVGDKTKAQFADGTVLNLLKQNDTTGAWGECGYLAAAGMTLPLLSWQTADVRRYDISVADKDGNAVRITASNQNDVLGDGTVSFVYDEANEKGTLTLNNANLVSETEFPINADDMPNLEIMLKGENKIHAEEVCIVAENLTFSGDGSLAITNGFLYAIDCTGAVTVNGGDIKVNAVDYALCLDGALTVNGGTLELIASDAYGMAIDSGSNAPEVILGGDLVMITGENPDGSDAKVTAAADTAAVADARYVKIFSKYIPVTYHPGEHGKENASVQNKTYGTDMTLSGALFTRNGYTQIGWATTDGGAKAYELGGTYTGNETLILYPVWQAERYSITYDLGGGTVTGNPDSYTVESEDFTLKNPVRSGGYEFAGWSGTGLTGTDNMTVTLPKGSTGDRSYTAHWADVSAPSISGLENDKTYCSGVEFTVTDNDGAVSVTVNGAPIQANNGKYTLSPAQGKQTVLAKDSAGNSVEITVTVNNGHTGGTATCKDKAVCRVCGAEYGALDPNNHTDLKHVSAKRSTTRTEGNREYWYCDGCGKYYKDAAATKEITRADTVIAKRSGNSGFTGTTSNTTSGTGKDTVNSSDTGDAGIALYGVMALLSLTGGAWLRRKVR